MPLVVGEHSCAWAWADFNRDVEAIANESKLFWAKKPGAQIECCTDGLNPVIFKIERIEE